MSKNFKPQVNDLVVFNHEPDATLFRVREIKGFSLVVVDRAIEHLNAQEQFIDVSLALPPTVAQLKQLNE